MKNSLTIQGPRFYARKDEDAFFNWLKSIKDVESVEGFGKELDITLKHEILSDETLKDLIAILYRYNIDMKQLAQYSNPDNENWFKDKRKYWYKTVFE